MAKGKQTPRQKMINLMYLVFIAMMALNIDVEIIRSFFETTESLKETRQLTEDNNTGFFAKTLQAKANAVPDTYAKPWAQYQELEKKITTLVEHVDGVKVNLKKEAGFLEKNKETGESLDVSENYSALNDNEATTNYFFTDGDEARESKKAKELIAKIDEVRNFIKSTFSSDSRLNALVARSEKALSTTGTKKKGLEGGKSWTNKNFYHQTLIAAISKLEILQNDARNLQSDALAFMLQEKVDAKIKFDNYEAIVKAPTDIVAGEKVQAEVYLATYTSNTDNVTIKGVSRVEGGKGIRPLDTSGEGRKSFSGSITVKMSDGTLKEYPYSHEYNVIAGQQEVTYQTGALLSADNMNVMYRGLKNPVSGSILGVDNSKLSLTASGGASVSKTAPGKWIVKPRSGNTVNLTISGTGPRGTTSKTFNYRIKNVPAPQGRIRNKVMVSIPASSLPKQRVTATIPDFDFPVTFTVTGFKVKVEGRATTYVKGSSLSSLSGMAQSLKSGDGVYIFDIEATATGLDGQRLKNISPVLINIL